MEDFKWEVKNCNRKKVFNIIKYEYKGMNGSEYNVHNKKFKYNAKNKQEVQEEANEFAKWLNNET